MSRIHEALSKLQSTERAVAKSSSNGFNHGGEPSSLPRARKKKIEINGQKHHVDPESLVKAGLLAPLNHAVPVADEFRRIKRPLIANATRDVGVPNGHMNVIMVASALPRAGKSFCSVNLAVSISLERELNVLLVDADVPKPHISREFGLGDAPGLIDLLVDESHSIENTLVRTDLNDMQVLPAGRGHPQATELLASERMAFIINELATRYRDRIILIDSPPLLLTSEAQALSGQVGQIALVVEAGETSRQALLQTIEALDTDKAINVILNKSRHASPMGYYGDYASYGQE